MSVPVNANSTNNFGVAQFIVDPIPGRGTHTSITNALTVAVAGQTIFLRPGTYTENFTLTAGVNLAAFECDAFTPNVTIRGKITLPNIGASSISGINITTNGDFAVSYTGSSFSTLNLIECVLQGTAGNTIINMSSTNPTGNINLYNCVVKSGSTSAYFSVSGGNLLIEGGNFPTSTSGVSTVSAAVSGGTVNMRNVQVFNGPITTNLGGNLTVINSAIFGLVTVNVSSNVTFRYSTISAAFTAGLLINAGAVALLVSCEIAISSGPFAIDGSGTVKFSNIYFSGSVSSINGSITQTPLNAFVVPISYTTDGVAYFDGAKLVTTTAGTSGQVLTSNGPGVAPTYQNSPDHYTATAISYQVLVTDSIIGVTSNAAARTITMPNSGMNTGQSWTIKDEAGTAQSANNITISGNGANIDGSSTFVINTNFGSASMYWNGSNFFVI